MPASNLGRHPGAPGAVRRCPTRTAPSIPSACPQANDEWAAKKARAKQLPWTMLDELKGAARAQEPGVQYPA